MLCVRKGGLRGGVVSWSSGRRGGCGAERGLGVTGAVGEGAVGLAGGHRGLRCCEWALERAQGVFGDHSGHGREYQRTWIRGLGGCLAITVDMGLEECLGLTEVMLEWAVGLRGCLGVTGDSVVVNVLWRVLGAAPRMFGESTLCALMGGICGDGDAATFLMFICKGGLWSVSYTLCLAGGWDCYP